MKKLISLLLAACLLLTACAAPDPAQAEIEAQAQAVDSGREKALAALSEHIDSLYDKFCTYYDADEYRLMLQDYSGSFGGVGISMIRDEDYIVVYQVLNSGPAKDSPLVPGDRIIAVDGESILGFDTEQAALLIRGEIGSPVTLTVLDTAEQEYELTLVRQEIVSSSLQGERIEEAENTAYILIYDFTGQTAQEFVDEYNRLREEGPIDWLIVDLRSNVGGNFYAAIAIGELFVPRGHTVVSEKLVQGERAYTSGSGQLQSIKPVVLENEWTASASEVLAGALRDEAGAYLIGTTSYGKGITQTIEPQASGGAWKYTRSLYYTPSGFDLNGVGLEPDLEVEPAEDITNEDYFSTDPARDPHLRAAVDYINSRL